MRFIEQVIDDLKESEANGRLLKLNGVTGLSGDKLVGFLQRSALTASRQENTAYLEVGVFQGLTLSSVASSAQQLSCFGIDNFSQFDPENKNKAIVKARLAEHCQGNGVLIDADFEEALLNLRSHVEEKRIAVYFVDGPHDYRSQNLCLDFIKPHLAQRAVIVVDDSNYEHVRRANCDWLKANPDFALLYESYTPAHPRNLGGVELQKCKDGWWNGVNIIVRDGGQSLSRIYPPVDASRERYLNDHLIHPHRYAELVPDLLEATRFPFLAGIAKFLRSRSRRPDLAARFTHMNTHSEDLPDRRLAEFTGSN